MSGNINFACLPKDTSETYSNQTLTLSGWGRYDPDYDGTSKDLRVAEVKEISNEKCQAKTGDTIGLNITGAMMCAEDPTGGDKGFCSGDSGGRCLASQSIVERPFGQPKTQVQFNAQRDMVAFLVA